MAMILSTLIKTAATTAMMSRVSTKGGTVVAAVLIAVRTIGDVAAVAADPEVEITTWLKRVRLLVWRLLQRMRSGREMSGRETNVSSRVSVLLASIITYGEN